MFSWKKWRSAAIALVAAFSVLVATEAPALASSVPGESGTWQVEHVNGRQVLYATGTIAEARNNGRLLRVWRANDNTGYLWAAWDNSGQAYRLDGAASWASPTITPWGNNGFAIVHTGTDGRIYWATYNDQLQWSGWHAINGQTTQLTAPPSVTQVGAGSQQLYMVYRSGSDFGMWGSFFDGTYWQNAQNLGGSTYQWPAVTWNQSTHRLYAVHTGTDDQVYMQWQEYGGTWHGWFSVGGYINGATAIAATSTGNMQVAGRDGSNHIWYREFNPYGYPLRDWSYETASGYQAYMRAAWPVFLSVAGSVIYTILTENTGHIGYYKQSYNGN
ncbi:hypothetical protein Pth03_80050 [Planotetraspora thailandica]|uniref:Tachylectin 2 domain-containing protein n=1 Tax=Planotetraspora thailandica TaxID=487172 RepID=A0A8J3Y2M6_9ACTN|nr:hypothetical protein [Planotetraspora thailandica]GII59616.1 hypothetical protein Pth03_80050 [Planotetraspora thailandica]